MTKSQGTTGSVFEGQIDGTDVIVKAVRSSSEKQPLWRLLREVYVQAAVSAPPHKNVCKLLGWGCPADQPATKFSDEALEEGHVVYIVIEHAGKGLFEMVNEDDLLAPHMAQVYLKQITEGLKHLHDQAFYHRDLKLENVSVQGTGMDATVKLIDFGSSTQVHQGVTMSAAKQRAKAEEAAKAGKVNAERLHHITKSQKAHTRAPEVVTGQSVESDAEAQEKLDIWGLGIILFGMVFGMAPFGESPATKEDFEQASNDTYKNAWAGESGYEESSQVPSAVKDAYKEDGASGAYSDLKELVDNMLKQKVEERWSLSQVATKLDLQIPKRLSEWLKETHTHEGAEIAAIYAEFFEPMQAKCGGDIDISDLKAKMTNEQLDEVIVTSGKKSPVQKKLFTRLHFELRYPLNAKQAKKIKVEPWPEEGVP